MDYDTVTNAPWGTITVLYGDDNSRTKRVVIHAGAETSLHWHHRKNEVYTVVEGIADFTMDSKVYRMGYGDNIRVVPGSQHKIVNKGGGPLVLIEVQTGILLDEKDIIRVQDKYGRA